MISFVLFPQASLPSLNFNISELVSLSLEIFKSLRLLAGKNESFRNLLTRLRAASLFSVVRRAKREIRKWPRA